MYILNRNNFVNNSSYMYIKISFSTASTKDAIKWNILVLTWQQTNKIKQDHIIFIIKAMRRMDAEFQEEKRQNSTNIIRDDHLTVEFMQLDLASLDSTMKFIETFKAKYNRLNLLICNAGTYSKNKGG